MGKLGGQEVDLELERKALYEAVLSMDHEGHYVTRRQITKLIILFEEGLEDKSRDTRIAVMRCLIGNAVRRALGVDLRSFKNLSSPIASMLIDRMTVNGELSEYGRSLLSKTEKAVKVPVSG